MGFLWEYFCFDSLNPSLSGPVNSCFCIASLVGEGREAVLERAGSSLPKVAGGRSSQHFVVFYVRKSVEKRGSLPDFIP